MINREPNMCEVDSFPEFAKALSSDDSIKLDYI